MANLTFTTTNWGRTLILSPSQLSKETSNSLQNSIRYLDGLEQVSEDVSSTFYRAGFDNDGVLTATGSGFDTSSWRLKNLTYSEPADKVAFKFSGNLQININSENFGGSLSSLQVKLFNLELAAAGTWNIDSSGNGTGVVREATYKQSGVTIKIEDSSIAYNGFQANGKLGKITVTSAQGDSLAISDSDKLTAPFLDSLESQTWGYFFSAGFLNGDDRLVAGNESDAFNGFAGHDRLFGKGGNDRLGGGTGNDSLYGENGNDVLRGDSGNDVLNGGPGADTMIGGAGSDRYYVDSAADRISELASSGNDSVYTQLSAYMLPANVENVHLLSTAAANATGNGQNNTLYAGAGNNVLNGGLGNDAVSYTYATSGVTVSLANTGSQATGGSGSDRLISIEKLSGSKFGDKLTGNGGDNDLSGGAGNDRIVGGAGNDTLNGGAGADTLMGGSGNDRFVLSSVSSSDTIGDFRSAVDKLVIGQSGIRVGDGNTVPTSSTVAGPGGFSDTTELVVITGNIGGVITAASAAAKIGAASAAYAVGRTALFCVDNGTDSALYLFTAANADARVSAGELELLAAMTGTPSTVVSDYLFLA